MGQCQGQGQAQQGAAVEEIGALRAKSPSHGAKQQAPVVIASPALEDLAVLLRERLDATREEEPAKPTVSWETFKSGDPNTRFNWQRLAGRRVIFLFDTVDQTRLTEQLSLLQALQGFPVPDGEDAPNKWKTYAKSGSYSWGRCGELIVVLPWYRPCQMERTSRWEVTDEGGWSNSNPEGQWLDVPVAQTLVRLLCGPSLPLPHGAGPSKALDGLPLKPLWRPPVQLLFVELHEEAPVREAARGLGVTVRMERFVPYFLDKFRTQENYPGKDSTFILFPDHGAYDRYSTSVFEKLGLEPDHVLYIKKTRVGGAIEQEQKLFFEQKGKGEPGEKKSFTKDDHVLIIDDFTNSGSTLFGAVNLSRSLAGDAGDDLAVSIFVSHLVAAYDPAVVQALKDKLKKCGKNCRFYTTGSIPMTTNLLQDEPQAQVLPMVDFLVGLLVTVP